MIRFSLKCSQNHSFDSWFQSSDAYEKLAKAGMLTCAECGDRAVEKSLMAPKISTQSPAEDQALSAPMSEAERNLAKIKQEIEANLLKETFQADQKEKLQFEKRNEFVPALAWA